MLRLAISHCQLSFQKALTSPKGLIYHGYQLNNKSISFIQNYSSNFFFPTVSQTFKNLLYTRPSLFIQSMFYFQCLSIWKWEIFFFLPASKASWQIFLLTNKHLWKDATNSHSLHLIPKIFFLGHVALLSGKESLSVTFCSKYCLLLYNGHIPTSRPNGFCT